MTTLLPHFLRIIDHFLEMVQFSDGDVTVDMRDVLADGLSQNSLGVILQNLKNNGCFQLKTRAQEEAFWTLPARAFSDQDATITLEKEEINTLKLYEQKRKLLNKEQESIIKPIALEHIARRLGESDSANSLIRMLRDSNVPSYLIVYPNTKWRMLDDLFRVLATSIEPTDHQLLFKVLEESCHPLRYRGDKERAQELQDFIADLICYDHYSFDGHRIKKVGDDPDELGAFSERESERDKRKEERKKESAKVFVASGGDPLGAFFGSSASRQAPPQPQRASAKTAESSQAFQAADRPIHIVINSQNVQHPSASTPEPAPVPKGVVAAMLSIYSLNELQIDLLRRVLRNTQTSIERDLSGFNYDFLSTLIAANGALVSYAEIAKASKTTVGTIASKGVMDRKSTFIKMLRTELGISAETCDELIQGSNGYRISRKIYE